jgi:uncharacterized protein
MIRRVVLTVVAWLCLACVSVAQTLVFPALTGRVVDEAGLLSTADRGALTDSLAKLELKTTDQLVVVTLKSLQGTTIEDYGYQLGRHWQIGQKNKNNGVLLIVAASERKVRIEVGYGLEGVLTDAATRLVIETSILPRFKTGDFAGGIKSGVGDIIQALGGDAETSQTAATRAPVSGDKRADANTPVWFIIVLGLVGVGLLVLCTMTTGGGLCRAILQMLLLLAVSGRGGSSSEKSSFSGGGGSFGGGGSSGSW